MNRMIKGSMACAMLSAAMVFGGCQTVEVQEKIVEVKAPTKEELFLDRVAKGEPMPVEEILSYIENSRDEWYGWGEGFDFPVHRAEKYLKDWTIVLDPGHGGDAHKKNWKRGPTGVREAAINLRVGLILKALLENSGAQVKLTRADDSYDMGLTARAEVANTIVRKRDGGVGADLFISLHHNAAAPSANYTTVWFHGPVKWSEPDLDPAKYVAHEIGWALRTQVGKTNPLMNDQQMYASGFGVLKMATVPAFLCESTFHTNPDEEQRLRDAEYNFREAYAIYKGLVEYAYGGRPTQSAPVVKVEGSELVIKTKLVDGSGEKWWGHDKERTISSSVNVTVDGKRAYVAYDSKTKELVAKIATADLAEGEKHEVNVHHINMFKHSNYPQRYGFKIAAEGKEVEAKQLPIKRNGLNN
ncbi:N-acetylmuramoyl-L-alanine amidase [Planctomycetota bacterium]|nr:N-acetylmuramoyl-L-alanine amidase [Planctomycetota bacterium]